MTMVDHYLLFLVLGVYFAVTIERVFQRYCETRLACSLVDGCTQVAVKIAPIFVSPQAPAANPAGAQNAPRDG